MAKVGNSSCSSSKYGNNGGGAGDIEAGIGNDGKGVEGQLYPGMVEDPRMRWAFIRKVYVLLGLQVLITSGLACTVFFVPPVKKFMKSSPGGMITLIGACLASFIFCILMISTRKKHPLNLVFMGLFTLSMGSIVGAVCAFEKGIILLEAAALTAVVTVALTLYTFWGARTGKDFSFLGPFLFASLWVLIGFALIRVFFPTGKLGELIAASVGALVFCGFIVYDTDNLIKRYTYDDYVEAACVLYLDILNLFLSLLQTLDASSSS